MPAPQSIDGVLVQWGDRLFYPGNKSAKDSSDPKLVAIYVHKRAAEIRARIAATVVRRAPQVMVKVTGGWRGMKAIAAHFRYISKNGRFELEDELGRKNSGKESLREVADDWRMSGTLIEDVGYRREALNIMLSMPRGTDPLTVQRAARSFAQAELAGHKYVMVLHDHQAHPHMHISVRAEARHGKRLTPRKADLHRWRETFALKLRELGIDAEATRQASRGQTRNYEPLWRIKACEAGRAVRQKNEHKSGATVLLNRDRSAQAWSQIGSALAESARPDDRSLAKSVRQFVLTAMDSRHPIPGQRLEQNNR